MIGSADLKAFGIDTQPIPMKPRPTICLRPIRGEWENLLKTYLDEEQKKVWNSYTQFERDAIFMSYTKKMPRIEEAAFSIGTIISKGLQK